MRSEAATASREMTRCRPVNVLRNLHPCAQLGSLESVLAMLDVGLDPVLRAGLQHSPAEMNLVDAMPAVSSVGTNNGVQSTILSNLNIPGAAPQRWARSMYARARAAASTTQLRRRRHGLSD